MRPGTLPSGIVQEDRRPSFPAEEAPRFFFIGIGFRNAELVTDYATVTLRILSNISLAIVAYEGELLMNWTQQR